MGLLTTASVAIDGSKFKAVNNRDQNFTRGKVERRRAQLEESVARYLSQLDTAGRLHTNRAADALWRAALLARPGHRVLHDRRRRPLGRGRRG